MLVTVIHFYNHISMDQSNLHSTKGKHAGHSEDVFGSQIGCAEQHQWCQEDGNVEGHVRAGVEYVSHLKAALVVEAESVALCIEFAFPGPSNWIAWKPAHDGKHKSPYSDKGE